MAHSDRFLVGWAVLTNKLRYISAPRVLGIVVGAGTGSRFGGLKQLDQLAGKPVLWHALEPVLAVCDFVVAVVPQAQVDSLGPELSARGVVVQGGGATRSESVRCGLQALTLSLAGGVVEAGGVAESSSRSDELLFGTDKIRFGAGDIVVIHDAARPLAADVIFRNVLEAVRGGADSAVPVVAVTDTIRHESLGPIDRASLRAVQTPQAFKAQMLWQAHKGSPEATDDATLVETIGGRVELVEGDPANFKITHQVDLAKAEAVLLGAGEFGVAK